MTRTPYTGLIREYAAKYDLDPDLVEGLVLQESGGKADAFRFEPLFWERYKLASKPEWKGKIARRWSSSYGLCQIMGVVAREEGFDLDDPELLFVPSTNLDFGCAHLRRLFDWADTFTEASERQRLVAALAAYNGGRGGNSPLDHPPRNGKYAESLLAIARTLQHT
jgi:soluble lytic murein transglycosylase-like protein